MSPLFPPKSESQRPARLWFLRVPAMVTVNGIFVSASCPECKEKEIELIFRVVGERRKHYYNLAAICKITLESF